MGWIVIYSMVEATYVLKEIQHSTYHSQLLINFSLLHICEQPADFT